MSKNQIKIHVTDPKHQSVKRLKFLHFICWMSSKICRIIYWNDERIVKAGEEDKKQRWKRVHHSDLKVPFKCSCYYISNVNLRHWQSTFQMHSSQFDVDGNRWFDGLADSSESMHNSIFWMRRRINAKSHIVFPFSFAPIRSFTFVVCLLVCIGNRTKTKANDHGHRRLYSALTKQINNQFTWNVDNPNHTHTWPIIIYLVYLEHTHTYHFLSGGRSARAPLTFRPDISIQCTHKCVSD